MHLGQNIAVLKKNLAGCLSRDAIIYEGCLESMTAAVCDTYMHHRLTASGGLMRWKL